MNTIYGCKRVFVTIGENQGFVILPNNRDESTPTPWVWYAPIFINEYPGDNLAWINTRLLENGIAICGMDVGDTFGYPKGREMFTEFHRTVVSQFGLAEKACLWPQSRGGLQLYNWAAEHPDLVKCIGGIYTVCDITSYPGLATAAPAYGMTEDELREALPQHNPVDRLAPIAAAQIPIMHIHGDNDVVVPLEENSAELAKRYEALGGKMELIIVPGKGHEEIPEFFERHEVVDFFVNNAKD